MRDDGPAIADASPTSSFYRKSGSFSPNEVSIPENTFHVASPPPPPPPPPPSFSYGSPHLTKREVKKSFKDELKDLSIKGREDYLKNGSLDSSPPRSVRTLRTKDAQSTDRAPAQQQKHQGETKKKKKKKVEFMEKIVMSDNSESEKASDTSDGEKSVYSSAQVRAEAEENEVDKKADEFIAKFREQIRLQRIESIKKSSGHRAVKNIK